MDSPVFIRTFFLTAFFIPFVSYVQASDPQGSSAIGLRGTSGPVSLPSKSKPFLDPSHTVSDSISANDTLNNVFDQDTTGMKKRLKKVRSARELKQKGEFIQEMSGIAGNALGTLSEKAPESNPATQALGNVFKITSTTVRILGTIVGSIIQGVARYKGKQFIYSTDEQLVRAIEDSFAKMVIYTEELEEFSTKRPTLKSGNSVTEKFKNIFNPFAWQGSIEDLLDKTYLTDFKGQRLEDVRQIQQGLKLEKENFEDYVRLLQIKLIEKVLKVKLAELHPDQIQFQLERDLQTLREAKSQAIQKVSRLDPLKNKTERAQLILTLKELEQKIRIKQNDLDKLLTIPLTQERKNQLEKEIEILKKEIKPLYELTRLYKAQQTSITQACCPEQFQALQMQIDFLKNKINSLQNVISDMRKQVPVFNSQATQREIMRESKQNQVRKLPPLPARPSQQTPKNYSSFGQDSNPRTFISKPSYRWAPPSSE